MQQFSKNTLKLLKVFYAYPEQQFYIQELGRILKKKPGAFQRALYNLEKDGALKSEFKANARFFSINKDYLFYKEFKSIVAKLSVFVGLFFILNFNIGLASEKEAETLELSSLKDTIKIAFANNKDIQIQEYALNIATADILKARSAFLPNVDFNAGYTHNGTVLTSSGDNRAKQDPRVFSGYKDNNTMGTTVSQSIYTGGANLAVLREAQLGLKEQIETLRATKLNVELDAKRLYYGLLLAYETERIAKDLVEQATGHYEEVRERFKQGTSSRFDVLQSKVQVSLLMPQLINAQTAIELIITEMDKLIGTQVGRKIIVKDHLFYQPVEIKEEEFLKEAYLNDPEMILKSLGIDISKWAIKYARAGWLPQVGANAGYSYTSNNPGNMFNTKHNLWDIGFAVTVPIFDGFSTKAKVDAAKAKYMQALISKENLADQVGVDVKQSCLDMVKAGAIIKAQQDNLEDAKEALKISYVRYDNGVGINLDVLDAQVSLANVEKTLAEGTYDYIMAKAKLDRVMGRGSIEEGKIQ
ncbi:MAG: TolC family protein [Candidatus Omnitrophica bacterium]|nr:TolC family protein [Candidatus Omnitrophota bacterium]